MTSLVQIFEALADENRLRIINLLVLVPDLTVADLVFVLDMPQTRVSRHLGYLKARGLTQSERRGTWMHYRTAPLLESGTALRTSLQQLFTGNTTLLGDVERLLEGLDEGKIAALKDAPAHEIEQVIQKCCRLN
ncbi:MAG: transcriptional regulator of arsenate reductase ArsR [Bacteroidetes bacterium HLUCCA01]|nr:MAG: transcriptional regulator of arsenate reductase ArsR [Bacteroidetes bacterium HLUCCA01]